MSKTYALTLDELVSLCMAFLHAAPVMKPEVYKYMPKTYILAWLSERGKE